MQLYGDVELQNIDQIKELQVKCVQDFNDTAPNIFDDILNEEDYNVKNNDASALIRDQGNQLYQKKQFKVKSVLIL